jgi:hypothetical protein
MRPIIDSDKMEIVSVVSPFNYSISSEIIFVKIPGALSLESNHPTCLLRILLKSLVLNVLVIFSPP